MKVRVIGGGLAGSEAAWQLAKRGIGVELCEMKPVKRSPAHTGDGFGELVCSNSLKSELVASASGLLKEELRRMGSLIIEAADATKVPAGGALAVDRERFSEYITEKIKACDLIEVVNGEVTEIPRDLPVIIATGPLTSDALAESISKLPGVGYLHFYDAAAPIVAADSIDMEKAFFGARYDKGTPDYINCPMTEQEYYAFVDELTTAEEAPVHGFEDSQVFEGCMPVEVMARRGRDTLAFGPLKPIGLRDPRTGKNSFAVVQLRRDNDAGTLYNIVGFQTHLRFGEQKRVFSMIPALKEAEFMRYGVMHRNTYIDSPRCLDRHYAFRADPNIMFAGQLTGVEGYIESTSSGFLAAVELARRLRGMSPLDLDDRTAVGALSLYISDETVVRFDPMGINFGIIRSSGLRAKKQIRYEAVARRSLEYVDSRLTDILA